MLLKKMLGIFLRKMYTKYAFEEQKKRSENKQYL